MVPYKRLDLHQRFMVVAKVLEGNSYRDFAISIGINFKTVGAIMVKHKNNISLADLPRVGKEDKTTSRKNRLLVRMSYVLQSVRVTRLLHILQDLPSAVSPLQFLLPVRYHVVPDVTLDLWPSNVGHPKTPE